MNCPTCQTPLTSRTYEAGVVVEQCPACHGMWLDSGEIEKIQMTPERNYSAVVAAPEQPHDLVAAAYEQARQKGRPELMCPKCRAAMFREEADFGSQVLVDKCPPCQGMWLDGGEIETLEIFGERLSAESRRERQSDFFSRVSSFFRK